MGQDASDRLSDGTFREALSRTLIFGTPSYIGCIDRQRRVLFLNRSQSRASADVIGKPVEEFVAAERREALITCIERAFDSGEPQDLEYYVAAQDGTRRHYSWRVLPFCSRPAEGGGHDAALLIADDVTKQHALTEELERSVEFRRRVVENLPGFVTLVDREHRFVWVNRVAPGLAMSDVIGVKVFDFISPQMIPTARAVIEAAFDSAISGQYEVEGYSDGNNKAWYLTSVAPVLLDGRVENVLMLTAEVTELKHAEQALRETQAQLHSAQRLESVGQLAGGIAHDFNNLLQVIAGNLSFARQELSAGRSVMNELQQALRATERAADLTRHLLAVGRRQRVDSKRIDLGQLVSHSMRMLRRVIPENIQLIYDMPPDPHFVDLDAPQFEQVLINLCVNARDAMPLGGTLTVHIQPHDTDGVVLSVVDSGVGIPQQSLTRVFDPFFTTKGTGSGLGLAVVAGIIAAHGGSIRAESDGVTGTTMRVSLPRVDAAPVERPLSSKPEAGGVGVILVAEDSEMVRTQVVRILEEAGYTVIPAENGARAVELFKQHASEVNLVLLDVIMPELDGWQAFLKMREIKQSTKVLFTTGYAADVLPQDFASQGARLLSKPFSPTHLLTQVRELLELAI